MLRVRRAHRRGAPAVLAQKRVAPRQAQRPRPERRAERVPADQRTNAPGQAAVAPADPRPRERLALPEVAVLGIVPLGGGDARGEAAALAARANPQVDRKGDTGGRDVTEAAGQTLDHFTPERVGFHALGSVGLAVVRSSIDEEDVEVGARGELASAKLAEADDDRGDETAVGGA